MPDLKVEYVKRAMLKPYERNARTHGEDQIAAIMTSIKEFGFTNPLLIDEKRGLIAGHGRLAAAERLGIDPVPTITIKGLTPAKRRALILADNQLALRAGWDESLLRLELGDLKAEGFDLAFTGFDPDALTGLLTGKTAEGLTDPDATPEPPKDPVSRLGDVWLLGDHRIICGDATDKAIVAKLLGEGGAASLLFTDPPYGVAYRDTGAGAWDEKKLAKKRAGTLKPRFDAIMGDDLSGAALEAFLNATFEAALTATAATAAWYVWHGASTAAVFERALLRAGMAVRSQIIWAKSRPAFNFSQYKYQHEPCFYAHREKRAPAWYGDKAQTSLWQVASESGAVYVHPTQKPVALATVAIKNSTKAGDRVLDLFLGSASTLIACEMAGRACLGAELAPSYVDVACLRWASYTGKVARLDADGRTFNEIAQDRGRAVRSGSGKGSRAPRGSRPDSSRASGISERPRIAV